MKVNLVLHYFNITSLLESQRGKIITSAIQRGSELGAVTLQSQRDLCNTLTGLDFFLPLRTDYSIILEEQSDFSHVEMTIFFIMSTVSLFKKHPL